MKLNVNGSVRELDAEPDMPLLWALREQLGLTGTKYGCGVAQCGACTVLVDGQSVKACMMLAAQADGSHVTTVEGLAKDGRYHAVQQAFWEKHGLQCGFCTSGFLMQSVQIVHDNLDPSDHEIREALEGNLCRCTGYQNIVAAVKEAAQIVRTGGETSALGSGVA